MTTRRRKKQVKYPELDKIIDILDFIVQKSLNGKWFLTVIVGLGFLYLVVNRLINPETAAVIILTVFKDYFNELEHSPKKKK